MQFNAIRTSAIFEKIFIKLSQINYKKLKFIPILFSNKHRFPFTWRDFGERETSRWPILSMPFLFGDRFPFVGGDACRIINSSNYWINSSNNWSDILRSGMAKCSDGLEYLYLNILSYFYVISINFVFFCQVELCLMLCRHTRLEMTRIDIEKNNIRIDILKIISIFQPLGHLRFQQRCAAVV